MLSSDHFLTALFIVVFGAGLAATLAANPPARDDSALFRRWTQGLPAAVVAQVTPELWQKLVRTYFVTVVPALSIIGAVVLIGPQRFVFPVVILSGLAVQVAARFFIRRYLLRQVLPLA
ncbi:hypothetical protein [Hymenobacter nivis]|uniref:Uncharacterized protein n=1 Tax=Hymenobacter nivis TaxID=1850093 RepID=A0A502GZ24_9BACT|nr:hypothetical protein [Hymenobacter nivis]TPG67589.1 hypothetical protein EAH73_07760 [Hymenobacter nivis]